MKIVSANDRCLAQVVFKRELQCVRRGEQKHVPKQCFMSFENPLKTPGDAFYLAPFFS